MYLLSYYTCSTFIYAFYIQIMKRKISVHIQTTSAPSFNCFTPSFMAACISCLVGMPLYGRQNVGVVWWILILHSLQWYIIERFPWRGNDCLFGGVKLIFWHYELISFVQPKIAPGKHVRKINTPI